MGLNRFTGVLCFIQHELYQLLNLNFAIVVVCCVSQGVKRFDRFEFSPFSEGTRQCFFFQISHTQILYKSGGYQLQFLLLFAGDWLSPEYYRTKYNIKKEIAIDWACQAGKTATISSKSKYINLRKRENRKAWKDSYTKERNDCLYLNNRKKIIC